MTRQPLDLRQLGRAYRRDGFVQLGPLLDEASLQELTRNADRYLTRLVPAMPDTVRDKIVRFEADSSTVRSCYSMQQIDPWFEEFGRQPRFRDIVEHVFGWSPELYGIELFVKAPRVGSRVPLHQETAFNTTDLRARAHLWIALDHATEENGPVRFWLGSHRHGLFDHQPDENGYLTFDEQIAAEHASGVYVSTVPAGGGTLHDGLIAHDSLPNQSDKPRRALFVGYIDANGTPAEA